MDERVNRSWVFCTAAAGVVLVLLAIVADVWWGLDNIVPSALLEMGAAALMAAVLFFVVPHFTARVADAVMDQMTAGGAPDASAATGTEGEEERAAWERTFLRQAILAPLRGRIGSTAQGMTVIPIGCGIRVQNVWRRRPPATS